MRKIAVKTEPRHGWRYAATALAGFFLGVVVTFSAIPTIRGLTPPALESPTFAERVIVLPLDDQTIGTLRRPIDLANIRPQTVSVQTVTPPTVLTPMSFTQDKERKS